MPPDDPEFLHALAKAVTALIIAHELADPIAATEALRNLLTVISANGTTKTRRSEALTRAIDKIGA